jgi:hypothetical protein
MKKKYSRVFIDIVEYEDFLLASAEKDPFIGDIPWDEYDDIFS